MIPELVVVALEFYRDPRRFPQFADARVALPPGVTELLAAPGQWLADERIGDTAATLSASVEECREAVPFFIKQVLLEPRGDHYRTLGVPRDAEAALIRQHYQYLIRLFHPDRDTADEGWDEQYAPRINEAYSVLRNPGKRREYDGTLEPEDSFGLLASREDAPPLQPSSPPPARVRQMSPTAIKVGAGLVLAVVLLFALMVLLQSKQPTLRMDAGSIAGTGSGPGVEGPRSGGDASGSAGGGAVDMKTETPPAGVQRPVRAQTTANPGYQRDSARSIEDLVRSRVEQATSAVLGPPRERTPAMPREISAQPLPAQPAAEPAFTARAAVGTVQATASHATVRRGSAASNTAASQSTGDQAGSAGGAAGGSGPDALAEITAIDLAELLRHMTVYYDAGDADAFAGLFSETAETSDASGRAAIRDLYAQYFALPESREMRIGRFKWQRDGDYARKGSGVARIITTPLNGDAPAVGDLALQLSVRQQPGGLRITAMHYYYK